MKYRGRRFASKYSFATYSTQYADTEELDPSEKIDRDYG